MKKIEKDIILKDLDYIYNDVELKKDKLNSIISLFIDEEPEIMKEKIEEKIKKTEKENNIENENDNINIENDNTKKEEEINNENIEDDIDKISSNLELPKDVKTLYRKIVMMIHPDKNKDKFNNELYNVLYRKIIKAKNENDKAEILYIAYKLKIKEVYDINDEHFDSIKTKIKEKQIESNNIQYNSYWVWYHTENTQLKKIMVNQISSKKY